MNTRIFTSRIIGFIALCLLTFFILGLTLYDAQVIHGQTYVEQSLRKQPELETVEVARGSILDRYGRVLVSNEVSYEVGISMKQSYLPEQREQLLQTLLTIAKEEDIVWNDTLNISKEAPFEYTTELIFEFENVNSSGIAYMDLTRLGKLGVEMDWFEDPRGKTKTGLPTAEELLDKMAESFGITEKDSVLRRELIGVVYELFVRWKNIYWEPYVFAADVNIEFTVKVKERGLEGVDISAATNRVYGTEYAAHLLGRVAGQSTSEWEYYKTLGYNMNDLVGKEGAELAFETYLRGTDGVRSIERNENGDITASEWLTEPVSGGNVVLTLDIDLQQNVEDILHYYIPRSSNQNIEGAAVVMVEANSGAVLAAGSYPTFQLETYGEDYTENAADPLKPLLNRAFQGQYPPASTFKMITGIAALEEGIVEPTTTIRDAGTYDFYEPNGPACWIYNQFRGSHGLQTVSDAIKNSCNYYFYECGRELGIDRIAQYAALFGLGVPTGIELLESSGVMAGPEYTESRGGIWYEGATLSVAIGQESSQFTPLQLANYIATLANGGTRYDAHMLQEVKSGDFSEVTYEYDTGRSSTELGLAPENVVAIHQGMRDLTESGSVRNEFANLRAMGITVGAKTGTAQLTSVASDTANSVFVCFAPYENPEVAVAVVVERGGASNDAALIAAAVLEEYFTSQVTRDEIFRENALMH